MLFAFLNDRRQILRLCPLFLWHHHCPNSGPHHLSEDYYNSLLTGLSAPICLPLIHSLYCSLAISLTKKLPPSFPPETHQEFPLALRIKSISLALPIEPHFWLPSASLVSFLSTTQAELQAPATLTVLGSPHMLCNFSPLHLDFSGLFLNCHTPSLSCLVC